MQKRLKIMALCADVVLLFGTVGARFHQVIPIRLRREYATTSMARRWRLRDVAVAAVSLVVAVAAGVLAFGDSTRRLGGGSVTLMDYRMVSNRLVARLAITNGGNTVRFAGHRYMSRISKPLASMRVNYAVTSLSKQTLDPFDTERSMFGLLTSPVNGK